MWNDLVSLDKQLFLLLNTWCSNPFIDAFFVFITTQKHWVVPALGGAALFIMRQRGKAVIILVLGLLTVALVDPLASQVIKPLVGRLRPCHPDALIEGARYLLGYKRSFSFPSNHAANMFGLATVLTIFYPRKTHWFVIGASLVAYSRIHTGVHYPIDVAAGALLGIVVGTLMFSGYKLVMSRLPGRRNPPISAECTEPAAVAAGNTSSAGLSHEPTIEKVEVR